MKRIHGPTGSGVCETVSGDKHGRAGPTFGDRVRQLRDKAFRTRFSLLDDLIIERRTVPTGSLAEVRQPKVKTSEKSARDFEVTHAPPVMGYASRFDGDGKPLKSWSYTTPPHKESVLQRALTAINTAVDRVLTKLVKRSPSNPEDRINCPWS